MLCSEPLSVKKHEQRFKEMFLGSEPSDPGTNPGVDGVVETTTHKYPPTEAFEGPTTPFAEGISF